MNFKNEENKPLFIVRNKMIAKHMNYKDFYKKPKVKKVQENLDDLDGDADEGLPKRLDGSLDIPHLGQPIHMGKIIQVGVSSGTPATGEVSGFTNVDNVDDDKENITAGNGDGNADIAAKTVGGNVVPGG